MNRCDTTANGSHPVGGRRNRPVSVFRDLSGKRFGRWTVLGMAELSITGSLWTCRCDCGTVRIRSASTLGRKSHATQSCGCIRRETMTRHGMSRIPEYSVWRAMIQRCTNPRTVGWHRYGGRGISVCHSWLHSFDCFIRDMGRKPTPRHEIDRINNNGNYEPGNCRWATSKEQKQNTSLTRIVEYNGESLSVSEWSRRIGVCPSTLLYRLKHRAVVDALTARKHARMR